MDISLKLSSQVDGSEAECVCLCSVLLSHIPFRLTALDSASVPAVVLFEFKYSLGKRLAYSVFWSFLLVGLFKYIITRGDLS
jgi:hypothetical protein